MRRTALYMIALIALTAANAFAFFPTRACPPEEDVPEWVIDLVPEEGKHCAVGSSEPSFYPEDAKKTAAANCKQELARNICTRVYTAGFDVNSSVTGTSIDRSEVALTDKEILDAVKEGAEIIEYWYDKTGMVSLRDRVTYAKCCIAKGAVRCR